MRMEQLFVWLRTIPSQQKGPKDNVELFDGQIVTDDV